MKKRIGAFAFLFYCSLHSICIAQLRSVYSFQQDDSLLKNNYYDQSVKTKEKLLTSEKRYTADYKTIYEERLEQVGLLMKKSTRIITSPEAQTYLQTIVEQIIRANPELKGTDARVVFSRDWWPNAYSMGDGTVVVNAGLMLYLANEAELVFVLCHELSHYQLDHGGKAIKKYVEKINSASYQSELKRLSKEEYRVNQQAEDLMKSLAFNNRRHSRENEAEADRQAFRFMKRTGYDCGAIKTCLQMLDKVDDSMLFQPIVLDRAFGFADYPFKKKWVQKESSIFSQLDEKDSPLTLKEKDSLKTHPDCTVRIKLLEDSLQAFDETGKRLFIVNEGLFNQLKKDFFVEITEENYREKNLSRNLYYSLQLLQDGKDSSFAIYSVIRALNEVYTSQKSHQLGTKVDPEGKQYPDDYNLLLRMLNRIRLEEVAEINYHFCDHYQAFMTGYKGFAKEMNEARQNKSKPSL
jgi:Zn-dependent protease with chaperone function